MSNFVRTMRLKGLGEEDVYFARRDRELIAELHKKKLERMPAGKTQGNPAKRTGVEAKSAT